jgi:hypothetical protein
VIERSPGAWNRAVSRIMIVAGLVRARSSASTTPFSSSTAAGVNNIPSAAPRSHSRTLPTAAGSPTGTSIWKTVASRPVVAFSSRPNATPRLAKRVSSDPSGACRVERNAICSMKWAKPSSFPASS